MNKELYVSSTPHETKVALVEDDSLAEVYYERENEYTLAGSIYKGRVTRVLPGMQSAFVDIGLERDAFLYVSDFLDLQDEEDEEFSDVKVTGQTLAQANGFVAETNGEVETEEEDIEGEEAEEEGTEPSADAAPANGETDEAGARKWRGRRRRRGRRGGRDRVAAERAPEGAAPADAEAVSETEVEQEIEAEEQEEPAIPTERNVYGRPDRQVEETEREAPRAAAPQSMPTGYAPMVLPGESISKYREGGAPPSSETSYDAPREEHRDDRGGRGRGRDRDDRGGRFGRGGRDRDRGGFRDRDRGPREPRGPETPLPANYTPILLPGESISKYRGVQPVAAEVAEPLNGNEAFVETQIEAPAFAQEEFQPAAHVEDTIAAPVEVVETAVVEHVPVPPAPVAEVAAAPVEVGDVKNEAEDEEPTSAEASVAAPRVAHYVYREEIVEEEQKEQPKEAAHAPIAEPEAATPEDHYQYVPTVSVASLPVSASAPAGAVHEPAPHVDMHHVAKVEAEASALEAEVQAVREELEDAEDAQAAETHEAGHYSPEGGPVVHEEMDDEESDMPAFTDHYNQYHRHDLEDDNLDPAVFGETVREAGSDTDEDDDEFVFDTADEFEESELTADEEEDEGDEVEESDEEEPVEGVAGIAAPAPGGQRRERGAFDRNRDRGRGRTDRDRGRRPGGRRMGGPRRESRPIPLISDVLKEGQEVLIQIAKEPIAKKGARITSHIALPGRFLVYMPTVNHIGVSRKINSDEERMRLKRIVASERENGHGGFIVRTAAAGIKEDELRADIRFLKHLWHEIRTRAENSKSPALIYHDLNLVERVLRDQVTSDFSQIWVDTQDEYERVVRFASRFQPSLVRRIKLYTKDTPLFEQFGVTEEINKSLKSKVWLKSGGSIVINQTEALVAIDINTGKYVGKTARLEDTIVKINCDAVKEIVRQIRLRDLGGIIVIDFIDMDERKNRQKVMAALEDALRADRAPNKVLQFNDFGLVAITRKRVKQSLERTLGTACPYCEATGFVKSIVTVCNEIFVEFKKVRKHINTQDVTLRVNPEVAKELKSKNGRWLNELEEVCGASILVKSDATLHQEQFDISY